MVFVEVLPGNIKVCKNNSFYIKSVTIFLSDYIFIYTKKGKEEKGKICGEL